ncbi:MAG: aldehyde dehydrogenase family protein [Rhodospirillales bacterium]
MSKGTAMAKKGSTGGSAGRKKDAGKRTLAVTAPFDGAVIGEVPVADQKTVEKALAAAKSLHDDRDAWLSTPQRIDILRRAAEIMTGQSEDLAVNAAREGGKPLIDSRVEVSRAIDCLHICIETLRSETGHVVPMSVTESSANRLAFTRTEPIGVVVAVSAFNHPLNLIAHQVAPAVAAGCPAVVKPAGVTPLSCLRFVDILREAGLPEAWCVPVVIEDREVSTSLVTDPRVAFFSFIGSPGVGWSLRSKLAPGTRCALEHGGAAPAILSDDADLDQALPSILKGGFYHAGQVCVSVQRVFAQKKIARRFAEQLAAQAARLTVGDPTDPATEVGPLIRPAETERVHEWVEEARKAGGEVVTGGAPVSESCYAPTVVYDPPAEVKLSTAEVFGPVVCVYPVADIDEAVGRANSLPFAFQAAVYSRDLDVAMRAYARLDASAVMINDHTAFRVDWMPFAGLRQSGLGVGGIPHTLHDMQIEKMAVIRSPEL